MSEPAVFSTPPGPAQRWWPPVVAAHLVVAGWLFWDVLFQGKTYYFRDLASYYYPTYVVLERAFAQHVWPLWNPWCNAGEPMLVAYPLDLLLAGVFGARAALVLTPALHVLIAMCGASYLARTLRLSPWACWLAGAVYGLSGIVISCGNLLPYIQVAAWTPWLLSLVLQLGERPRWRTSALLGVLIATEISTFGLELIVQNVILAFALAGWRGLWNVRRHLLASVAVGLLLSAPVVLGTLDMLRGTERGAGFSPDTALAFSATPAVLAESLLPELFGNLHTFSDVGFWGQDNFPGGFPYFLSLYIGLGVVTLALIGSRRGLWLVVALGVLLSLGAHGPLAPVLAVAMKAFRVPVKFFFLSSVVLCLLAAIGFDRLLRERLRAGSWVLLPGFGLLVAAACLAWEPRLTCHLLGRVSAALSDPRAVYVATNTWPASFGVCGLLLLGMGLVLRFAPRLTPAAGVLVVLDLLRLDGGLMPATRGDFYALQPSMRALVESVAQEGRSRWFSYGAPGVQWAAAAAQLNSDVPLYSMERQSLASRTPLLDGLEGAFDVDTIGWAPPGATLSLAEAVPTRFPQHAGKLRMANVRWVLSFMALPETLARLRGQVQFAEVVEPLGLYEVVGAVPRAYWVRRAEVATAQQIARTLDDASFDWTRAALVEAEPPAASSGGPGPWPDAPQVGFEQLDPGTIAIHASTPPGFIVVVEGHHPGWHVSQNGRPVPLLRANGRYWAIPTPGGSQSFTARFEPDWLKPSLALLALGIAGALYLWLRADDRSGSRG